MNHKNKKSKKQRRNSNEYYIPRSNASKNNFPKLHNNKLDLGFISWAENYTSAVTGQLKHQIQYWKTKALALQQENKELNKIIQENNFVSKRPINYVNNYENYYDSLSESNTVSKNNNNPNGNARLSRRKTKCNMEVSNEFIEFLVKNKDIKEKARLEREKLSLQLKNEVEEQIVETAQTIPREESLKRLYGEDWTRISAMETSLACDWITKTYGHKPSYWPIIPFNLRDL